MREMRGLTRRGSRGQSLILGWWYRLGKKESTEPLGRREFQEQANTQSVNDQLVGLFLSFIFVVFCFLLYTQCRKVAQLLDSLLDFLCLRKDRRSDRGRVEVL